MKFGIDIFCSSPSSTATLSRHSKPRTARYDQESCHNNSSSNTTSGSITPRLMRVLSTPCSSSFELPLIPNHIDYQRLQKQQSGRKSTSSCYLPAAADKEGLQSDEQLMIRRRSSVDKRPFLDQVSNPGSSFDDDQITNKVERRSTNKSKQLPPLTLVHISSSRANDQLDSPKLKTSSSAHERSAADKVVELWVSLHCKGCEAKVKKHISKMEGVKSFSTEFAIKKVTIISSMNPHEVLSRVSRVKYAQFWPSSQFHSSSGCMF